MFAVLDPSRDKCLAGMFQETPLNFFKKRCAVLTLPSGSFLVMARGMNTERLINTNLVAIR